MGEKGEEGGKRRREMREDGGEEQQYKNGEDLMRLVLTCTGLR